MKEYIKKVISSSDDADEKRIISLLSFFVLVLMVIIKAFGYQVDNTLIYVFASLTGGSSVLTVIDKLTSK
jgi:hypothetical protein